MIPNASFEQPDGADVATARHWLVTSSGTGEEAATFNASSASLRSAYEAFETGWLVGAGRDELFIDLDKEPGDLEHLPIETMSFWSINQVNMTLSALEAATYNGNTTTIESFTGYVPSVDTDFVFTAGELEELPLETFEWASIPPAMGSTDACRFNNGADSVEAFITRPPQIVYVQGGSFVVKVGNYVGAVDDVVTFTSTDVLPEQVAKDVRYYVFSISGGFVFNISRTPRNSNGSVVSINDSGTGVHSVNADPTRFWIANMP